MRQLLLAFFIISTRAASAADSLSFRELEKGEGWVHVFLEPSRLKIDLSEDGKAVRHTMVFKKAKQETTVLDHGKKEFIVMDKESLKKLAGTVSNAMEQMKAAMSKLPPEMQKMMKEKMAGVKGPRESRTKVEVKKVKSGERVGQWTATHYELGRAEDLVTELWTVPLKDLGVEKENFEVMKAMGDTFAEVSKEMGKVFGSAGTQTEALSAMREIEGFPVKTLSKRSGKEKGYLLEKAEKKDLSDADFAVPQSYKKKNFGVM